MGYKLKKATIRVNGVENQVRPSGGGGWQPGANTLAYYPLESDANDYSGNGYNGTVSETALTYGAIGGSAIDSAFLAKTTIDTTLNTVANTINFWMYKPTSTNDPYPGEWKQVIGYCSTDTTSGIMLRGKSWNSASGFAQIQSGSNYTTYQWGNIFDRWINICITTTGSSSKCYVDGNEIMSANRGFGTATHSLWIGSLPNSALSDYGRPRMHLSHIVLESTTRTQQEIQDYYNQTKSNYGL